MVEVKPISLSQRDEHSNTLCPPPALFRPFQAYGFYDDINKVLDFYIGLVPSETKTAADKLVPAKRAALPKFLFKENSAMMREKLAIS